MSRYRTKNVLSIWEEPEEKNCWETDYFDEEIEQLGEEVLGTMHPDRMPGLFDLGYGDGGMFHSWDEDRIFRNRR